MLDYLEKTFRWRGLAAAASRANPSFGAGTYIVLQRVTRVNGPYEINSNASSSGAGYEGRQLDEKGGSHHLAVA